MSGNLYLYLKLLGLGTLRTLEMSVAAAFFTAIASSCAGVARLARWPAARWISGAYIEVFRGSSVYVQLFWAYFVLPFLGIDLSAFTAGVIAIGLNTGAYGADIVRGAILTVPREQIEACISLNLSRTQCLAYVIAPQAFRIILPSIGNYGIEIVKATSLVSLISISDLTYNVQVIRMQTGLTAVPFLAALLIYFCINSGIAAGTERMERGLNIGMGKRLSRGNR